MRILFVKANKIGSHIIRWGTGEPASHVAVEFESSQLVYHSYAIGICAATKARFYKDYQTVASIQLNNLDDREIFEEFFKTIPSYNNYDYTALLYFAWRAALKKYLGKPLPVFNTWQDGEGFLCTEITYILADVLARELSIMILPEGHDIAMVSPWQLFELINDKVHTHGLPFTILRQPWA